MIRLTPIGLRAEEAAVGAGGGESAAAEAAMGRKGDSSFATARLKQGRPLRAGRKDAGDGGDGDGDGRGTLLM